jgi:hypothetical protein
MFFPTISFIYSDDTDLFGLCGVSTTSVPEPSSGFYGATLGADGAIFASEARRYAARVCDDNYNYPLTTIKITH